MNGYIAYTLITLRLTLRDKTALFFNYIFPLLFFFVFAESSRAEQGGVITQVVTMVLILAVLGNGLYGAGVRAVQDREQNILRRFKVAPISPAPILVASMITGWAVFMPVAVVTLGLSCLLYGMAVPAHSISLLILISLGAVAFRAIGLIVASVVNSAQESTILTQLLYLPMLFLSGAILPIALLPEWAQILVQILPASYLSTGFQGILMRGESLAANWASVVALVLTTVAATFLSMKLFRWEKEEKLPASAKLWLLVVLVPFFVLGVYQAYSRDNVNKARLLYRDMRRSRTLLIRDARIFTGDGKVVETGAVLVRNGKIDALFEGASPDPKLLRAEVIEGSGKTLLPGLIDTRVHLSLSGGGPPPGSDPRKAVLRALAAYLYCGVTTVRSAGDPAGLVQAAVTRIRNGERLGAEVRLSGPDGAAGRVEYGPRLSAEEGRWYVLRRETGLLERSLVLQVTPGPVVDAVRQALRSGRFAPQAEDGGNVAGLEAARENLRRAYRAGVTLVMGTDAGRPLVFHGPALHRELQLWVESGIPAGVALQAATRNAARLLDFGDRIGLIRAGHDADLLLVDGNPLQDIAATERISLVILKGERIDRSELFDQE